MYVEEQAFGDRQWFRPASERQRYQLQAKKHSLRLIKRPLSRLPVSPIIIERLRLLSVPKFARCSPTLGFARQETVNLLQNTPLCSAISFSNRSGQRKILVIITYLPKGPLELGEMPELNV